MIHNKDSALRIAEELLKIKAVKLQPNDPFTWASGWKSPIYCDNRITLSFPSVRTFIRQEFAKAIIEEFGKPDLIAGVATGGVPQGVLIAQELGLPFIYIRSEAKDHGMGNLIEGKYEAGQRVIVIEDLISTGKSSIEVCDILKDNNANGCNCKKSLDNAIITSPEMRSREVMSKLKSIISRINSNFHNSVNLKRTKVYLIKYTFVVY